MIDIRSSIKLSLLSAVMVTGLAACGGVDERKADHAEKAHEFFESGNFEKARLEFKNVVYIDPKDTEGHYWLARTHEKLGDIRPALGEYLNVLKLDPENLQAKARIGFLYASHGGAEKAEEYAKEILAVDPQYPDALVVMAAVEAQRGNNVEALAQAKRAVELDPDNSSAVVLLSGLYLKANQPEDAVKVVKEAIGKHPNDLELKLQLARVYMVAEDFDKAVPVIQDVISIEPENLKHRVLLSGLYLKMEQPEKAEAVLQKAVTDLPDQREAKLVQVEFVFKQKGEKAAEALLKDYAAKDDGLGLKQALGMFYEKVAKADKAEEVFTAIVAEDPFSPEGVDAMNRLAAMYATQGRKEEAQDLIAKILEDNPKDERALLLKGKMALAEGDTLEAVADFRSLLKQQPNSVDVRRLLARAHVAAGNLDLARNNLQKAVKVDERNAIARLELAELEMRMGSMSAAKKYVEEVLAMDPNQAQALNMLMSIQVKMQDTDGAIETAQAVQQSNPGSGLGYYLEGKLLQADRRLEESNESLKKALDKQPTAVEPLILLVNNYLKKDDFESAHAIITKVLAGAPENFIARNLNGEVYLAEENFDAAAGEFRQAIAKKKDWWVPRRNLSIALKKSGKSKEAIASLEQAVKEIDNSERLMLELAVLYGEQGERAKAVAMYERLLVINPKSVAAKNNLAMILVDDVATEKDKQRALELIESLSGFKQPSLLDTLAWVKYRTGDTATAEGILKDLVAAAPELGELQYHLGMVLKDAGKLDAAKRHLRLAVSSKDKFAGKDAAKRALDSIQ